MRNEKPTKNVRAIATRILVEISKGQQPTRSKAQMEQNAIYLLKHENLIKLDCTSMLLVLTRHGHEYVKHLAPVLAA
ncbi:MULTISPECIES: hypothetical protein [unclassified Bradyrhizobium]|uniref:hypothetical protein n=1 Tax=unclassified Bradyrhizobium TaxID=2631580 RepID=UPI0033927C49